MALKIERNIIQIALKFFSKKKKYKKSPSGRPTDPRQ